MSCWPVITNTMAAASMFSRLSDKLSKFVCGVSPPPTMADDDAEFRAGLSSLLLLSPSSERRPQPRRSWSSSSETRTTKAPDDEDELDDMAMALPPAMRAADDEEAAAAAALPCLAFPSEHGYRVFSFAHGRMCDDAGVRVLVAPGRRLVPSPGGGKVLATDVCYRHPCQLVDPFTGERAPLPDLPIPFSEREPVPCRPEEPLPRSAVVTGDGLAWDWSPRGVMVARGDTAFFCEHGGAEWAPVHRSRRGSAMSVNYRAGCFFILEFRTLRVTAIADAGAGAPRARAEIPPPPGVDGINSAYLAPSDVAGDVFLLVRRDRDGRGAVFSEAYRARLGSRRPARWARVEDIGDRSVFLDGAHGFTVRAGPRAQRNCVYVPLTADDDDVKHPRRPGAVKHDVGLIRLTAPDVCTRLELDVGVVERMWGEPYWIMRKHGSDHRPQDQ
ncbi:hypothetical protein ACP70R_002933 [Stipagrostis hirtigluma subsp. patula]